MILQQSKSPTTPLGVDGVQRDGPHEDGWPDTTGEIAFLTRALKPPTLREPVPRPAERARAESRTHEEFLATCLQREVAARESHGGEGRIQAARFSWRKSLEEFVSCRVAGARCRAPRLLRTVGAGRPRNSAGTS